MIEWYSELVFSKKAKCLRMFMYSCDMYISFVIKKNLLFELLWSIADLLSVQKQNKVSLKLSLVSICNLINRRVKVCVWINLNRKVDRNLAELAVEFQTVLSTLFSE